MCLEKEYGKLNSKRKPSKQLKCTHCENAFNSSSELENHLERLKLTRNFKCDKCEREFHTKYRLEKHMTNHISTEKIRNCHYFNSGKPCPYEVLGCKFTHEYSAICKFGDKCVRHMCQFRH